LFAVAWPAGAGVDTLHQNGWGVSTYAELTALLSLEKRVIGARYLRQSIIAIGRYQSSERGLISRGRWPEACSYCSLCVWLMRVSGHFRQLPN